LAAKAAVLSVNAEKVSASLGLPAGPRTVRALFVTRRPVAAAYTREPRIPLVTVDALGRVVLEGHGRARSAAAGTGWEVAPEEGRALEGGRRPGNSEHASRIAQCSVNGTAEAASGMLPGWR
jgi:hypothetical protein